MAYFHSTLAKIVMMVEHGVVGGHAARRHHALWLVDIPSTRTNGARRSEDLVSSLDITWRATQIETTHSIQIPYYWTRNVEHNTMIPENYICIQEWVLPKSLHAAESVAVAVCLSPEGTFKTLPMGCLQRNWTVTPTKQRFIEELKTFTSWEMAGRYISILNGVGSHGKNSHGTSHIHNEIVLDCFGVG